MLILVYNYFILELLRQNVLVQLYMLLCCTRIAFIIALLSYPNTFSSHFFKRLPLFPNIVWWVFFSKASMYPIAFFIYWKGYMETLGSKKCSR